MPLSLNELRQQQTDITRLAIKHGAHNIRIFGSVARGETTADSDVDVLAAFESGRSLLDLIALQQDLSDLLGQKVDVVSEGALETSDRILGEAVSL